MQANSQCLNHNNFQLPLKILKNWTKEKKITKL